MSSHHSGSEQEDNVLLSDYEHEGPQNGIWTKEEEVILHESIKTYCKKPKNEKSHFVRKEVAQHIKELMVKEFGKEALAPGGAKVKDWKVKKKVRCCSLCQVEIYMNSSQW